MIAQGEGIDNGVGALDLFAQKHIEPVVIDASALGCTVEAAEASSLERKLGEIHKACTIGKGSGKVLDESAQALVLFPQVAHDDGVKAVLLFAGVKAAFIRLRRLFRRGLRVFVHGVFGAEDGVGEKPLKLSSSLLGQHVLHIRREAMDHARPEIVKIFLHEAVGRHIEEVLGGRELGHIFVFEGDPLLLHELHEAVQL